MAGTRIQDSRQSALPVLTQRSTEASQSSTENNKTSVDLCDASCIPLCNSRQISPSRRRKFSRPQAKLFASASETFRVRRRNFSRPQAKTFASAGENFRVRRRKFSHPQAKTFAGFYYTGIRRGITENNKTSVDLRDASVDLCVIRTDNYPIRPKVQKSNRLKVQKSMRRLTIINILC